MREIFDDIFLNQPLDPSEAARRGMRRELRRRFYAAATVAESDNGFVVLLDGKPVRTPARRPLAAPSARLAQSIADEWGAQREVIDPAAMPLTRLANTIIDGVAETRAQVAAEVEKYLGTDLLLYRAGDPAGLVSRQATHWDPILAWARETLGARFILTEGVMHVAQPPAAVTAAVQATPEDAWRLGAVHAVMTLTGSALIALALASHAIDVDAAWAAAHVDEDWNMEQWGRDELALQRRAARFGEMTAAALVLQLVG